MDSSPIMISLSSMLRLRSFGEENLNPLATHEFSSASLVAEFRLSGTSSSFHLPGHVNLNLLHLSHLSHLSNTNSGRQ